MNAVVVPNERDCTVTVSSTPKQTVREYEEKDSKIDRDRIVILGRRSAGKTVYLSLLYDKLWRSKGDLSMKALAGAHHVTLVKTAEELRQTKWPAATQAMTQVRIAVNYEGKEKLIVALDYPGELFTNAFVKDMESEEISTLFDHIDHAQAIMLLVDPTHVSGDDIDATIDNDFGIVQALIRAQNWAGGDKIPVVLVLTKIDQTEVIIKKHGGTEAFVRKYFQKLIAQVDHLIVCKTLAVEVVKDAQGNRVPKKSFRSVNLVKPLRYCLDVVHKLEIAEKHTNAYEKRIQFLDQLDAKNRKKTISLVFSLFILFLALLLLIIYAFPSALWKNLWHNIF